MRSVVYTYIRDLRLKGYTLTDSLPYENSGDALYLNNKKHIYVDIAQVEQQPIFDTLNNGQGTIDEITTVSVYFVNDAKKLSLDYDQVVTQLKGARTATGTEGFIQKLCQVSTNYQEDAVITTLEFSFRKLITN